MSAGLSRNGQVRRAGGALRAGESPGLSSTAEEPGRERDDGNEELKNGLQGEAQEPERQGQEPDDRIEDEGQNRQRPADDEENEPQQEFQQISTSDSAEACIESSFNNTCHYRKTFPSGWASYLWKRREVILSRLLRGIEAETDLRSGTMARRALNLCPKRGWCIKIMAFSSSRCFEAG